MQLYDLIQETTTDTGSGPLTPAGAVSGFRTFASVLATEQRFPYSIRHDSVAESETGIGYLDGSGDLVRERIEASTNGGAAVSFSAGTKFLRLGPLASMSSIGAQVGLQRFRR